MATAYAESASGRTRVQPLAGGRTPGALLRDEADSLDSAAFLGPGRQQASGLTTGVAGRLSAVACWPPPRRRGSGLHRAWPQSRLAPQPAKQLGLHKGTGSGGYMRGDQHLIIIVVVYVQAAIEIQNPSTHLGRWPTCRTPQGKGPYRLGGRLGIRSSRWTDDAQCATF